LTRPCDIQASGAIDLYFYGELAAGERRELEGHLARCVECRSALDELQTIRAALAARPAVASPPGGDWTSLMARIGRNLADVPVGPVQALRGTSALRRRPWPAYLAIAALLTLVTSGVTYVARHQPGVSGRPEPVLHGQPSNDREDIPLRSSAPAGAARPDAAFAAVSEQHFERSKLVILGLTSRDAQTSSSTDWAYERQLAGTLLDDTRLYRRAAAERGLESIAGVMSDLELVLLQASLADQRDATTLDRLQRLIQKRDLVSKMDMATF
jgi:hypothetical protein